MVKCSFGSLMMYIPLLLVLGNNCFAQGEDSSAVSPIFDPQYLVDLKERAVKANEGVSFRESREYGSVTIRTGELSGAVIYFEGPKEIVKGKGKPQYIVGNSPIQNLKLFAGKHIVRAMHLKGHTVTDTIEVAANSHRTIDIPMVRKKAVVVAKTRPAGATVSYAGKQIGITDDDGLILPFTEPGNYLIQIEKKGYRTVRQVIKVVDGEIQGVNALLVPDFAAVRISTPDKGYYAYVNNIYRGMTPITVTNVWPGAAKVRVEKDKFAPTSASVLLRAGETTAVALTPLPDKSVRNVSPYGELKGSWGDRDGDGIPNNIDNCPDDPEDIDGFEDSDGCPDPDNDGDGIPDIKDKCPNEPEDFDGFEDEDGCPDKDNDGDNIPDSLDLCPDLPEDRDGFEDFDGCPEYDNDGDGISDSLDIAINEMEDWDGFMDADGVPDRDNDNDGVVDYMDICPDAPETYNNFQDDDGCPDERIAEPPKGLFARMPYRIGEALHDSLFARIDSVYDAMRAYPEIQIEIKVHSDNRGNAPRKMEYTKQIALLINTYFDTRKWIAPQRYSVKGVGGTDPVASNVSEEGRSKNTRIEIKRIK